MKPIKLTKKEIEALRRVLIHVVVFCHENAGKPHPDIGLRKAMLTTAKLIDRINPPVFPLSI